MTTQRTSQNILIGAMTLLSLLTIASANAATFVVNDDRDPEAGLAENCTSGLPGKRCTLRDALAAADHEPNVDSIVFDLDKPIYLNKRLSALHPIQIDGEKNKVSIRVSQGYTIATLADRFEPHEAVDVMLPEYSSTNGNLRPMLELRGVGSIVRNLKLDGSITPHGKDLGTDRIDYDSDYRTDFILFTLNESEEEESSNTQPSRQQMGARWPIAGGIAAIFQPVAEIEVATAIEISDCELTGHNTSAIKLENFSGALLTGNIIEQGLANLPYGSGSGIAAFFGKDLVIANNTVSGYREGIATLAVSGMQMTDNLVYANEQGIFIEYTDASEGTNTVAGNVIDENSATGLAIAIAENILVADNQVQSNGMFGIDIKSAGYLEVIDNRVVDNGSDTTFHGGIRVAEGAGAVGVVKNYVAGNSGFGIVIDTAIFNTILENAVHFNGGAGIVLVNGANANTVTANTASGNQVGILSTTLATTFPAENQIFGNILNDNLVFDGADFDPGCSNTWSSNTFESVNPGAEDCIR